MPPAIPASNGWRCRKDGCIAGEDWTGGTEAEGAPAGWDGAPGGVVDRSIGRDPF